MRGWTVPSSQGGNSSPPHSLRYCSAPSLASAQEAGHACAGPCRAGRDVWRTAAGCNVPMAYSEGMMPGDLVCRLKAASLPTSMRVSSCSAMQPVYQPQQVWSMLQVRTPLMNTLCTNHGHGISDTVRTWIPLSHVQDQLAQRLRQLGHSSLRIMHALPVGQQLHRSY